MKKHPAHLILFCLILAVIAGSLSYFRLLDVYELVFLDLRFKLRPVQKINPQIVIVEIGNDTLEKLCSWPLPRDYHASLIKVLADCGAQAIIFDVLFSEPQQTDALLTQALSYAGNVYLPYALHLKQGKAGFWEADRFSAQLLPELLAVSAGSGAANVLADSDGKRRRIPLFIKYQDKLLPQISLKAAAEYLGVPDSQIQVLPGRYVQLGRQLRIPIDEEGAALVNLAGKWTDTFRHYSYCDILMAYAQSEQLRYLPPLLSQLKGAICFVGLTATGTADINASALERAYPMVGLQANLFNSLLNRSFLRRVHPAANLVILLLLCLFSIFLTLRLKVFTGLVSQIALLSLFIAGGFLIFSLWGLWIDLFFPLVTCSCVYLGTNLVRYLKELRNRELLEKELSIARDIQRSFLKTIPEIKGVDIAVAMDTARHVGGDLYDFIQFSDGRIGLMIGDVSGKGVPAALFMAQVISKFRYFANICPTAAETLSKLNQDIALASTSGMFVTMAYLIYDPATSILSFASAGHLPPLIFRRGQLFKKIEVDQGIPLGLIPEADFSQAQLQLNQQDFIVLYTDGVTEARDSQAQEFGEAALIEILAGKTELTSQQVVQQLNSALNIFVGRSPQHDDITVMVLRLL